MHLERLEDIRHTFRGQGRITIRDVEVEMWARRIAGIAEQREHLTTTHFFANTHANAFRLEMAVKGEITLPQIEYQVIAGNGIKRDGHRFLGRMVRMPFVLRMPSFTSATTALATASTSARYERKRALFESQFSCCSLAHRAVLVASGAQD